ncbi:MAG TPA: class I SAM-dependent methyltransferase [Beijerinckiaceae bacterium]|nr:class I SAM-dependent methyltransferase [Beijerinckiaceae bacterium]
MSGFAADWLALRESADRRARNTDVLTVVSAAFSARRDLTIVDLGCGAGSNLRALAPHLGAAQHWRLVDNDQALLAAARETLIAWAGGGREEAGRLVLQPPGRRIDVTFESANLAEDYAALLAERADLVTAAAFFDLVSQDWIAAVSAALAARSLPLYAVLTYDGAEHWSPPHPADRAVLAAFHAHQSCDKGFGPAAGPKAAAGLENALHRQGYAIVSGESPWRLGADDRELIAALADGVAAAVAETGLVPDADCRAWRTARIAAEAAVIGHADVFAHPQSEIRTRI